MKYEQDNQEDGGERDSLRKLNRKARKLEEVLFWRKLSHPCFGHWNCLVGGIDAGVGRFLACRWKRTCRNLATERRKSEHEIPM